MFDQTGICNDLKFERVTHFKQQSMQILSFAFQKPVTFVCSANRVRNSRHRSFFAYQIDKRVAKSCFDHMKYHF